MRYILSAILLLFSCTTLPENIAGCTDSNACNFNTEANEDDGSCSYAEENYNCGSICVAEFDCMGVCGGSNLIDCLGICGGGAYWDQCNICRAVTEIDCLEADCINILSAVTIEDITYQCVDEFTESGYYCNDLYALQKIMQANPNSIYPGLDEDSNSIISVFEYGNQNWIDGRLVSLDLNYNENVIMPTYCKFKLDTLPANIGELDALKTLNLKNNKISTLPEEISDLDNLEKLILESNRLKSFPESIGTLKNLEILYAHHNQITSLPSSFVELTNLQVLWLHFNNISFLPVNLGNMINLETLWLHNNQIEEIPASIGELESLEWIRLEYNQLSSLPAEICNLGVDINGGLIINLSISDNKTCPIYPACVDIILGYQDCEDCESGFLIGDGSDGVYGNDSECLNIGDWQALQDIIDANDVYSGLRPLNIVDFSFWSKSEGGNRLNELILNSEGLTGKIPESIGNLDNLETLRLEGNRIIGGIPVSIGNLHLIQEIKLNSNNLGCFEYDDFNGYCITHCDDSNGCSGKLPDNLTTLAELEILDLKDNYFTQIPEGMNNLTKLRKLKLKNNLFQGVLPLEIFDIKTLTWLDVSRNQFTGTIPENINELEDMTHLYFSYNQLSGTIPEGICELISLNQVYFNSNQFCPPYPECIISQVGYQDTSLCTE